MALPTPSSARPPRASKPFQGKSGKPSGRADKFDKSDRGPKPEPKILFQKFFKSVGPRTYAAQIKEAANGNHFLVLTEGKRDEKTSEVRKTRLFLYSEDFVQFFRMLHETAQFIKANPLPEEVRRKRERFWAKANKPAAAAASRQPETSAPTRSR